MKYSRGLRSLLLAVVIAALLCGCALGGNQPIRIENAMLNAETVESREWRKEYDELAEAALSARKRSYSPYSHYAVGAALLAQDGTIYTGCNVENASYPAGVCAERTAFAKAVSEGCQSFKALVIVGASSEKNGSDFCSPCGICRQVIREFCAEDFPIILVRADENGAVLEYKLYTLSELLPDSFGPENLR